MTRFVTRLTRFLIIAQQKIANRDQQRLTIDLEDLAAVRAAQLLSRCRLLTLHSMIEQLLTWSNGFVSTRVVTWIFFLRLSTALCRHPRRILASTMKSLMSSCIKDGNVMSRSKALRMAFQTISFVASESTACSCAIPFQLIIC